MIRKVLLIYIFVFLGINLYSQSQVFELNYSLAKKLYENDIIELLLNKKAISEEEKQALFLAVYYKSSTEEIILKEEMKKILILTGIDVSENQSLETEFYKMINNIDKLIHSKDFTYLEKFVEIPL